MTIRPKSEWPANLSEKWKACYWCDKKWFKAILNFDAGSVEPTDGETLTGATSGDTGVVDRTVLLTGSYAGGDAAGFVELTSPTGADSEQGTIFEDDELINGSTGGSGILTADGDGIYQQYGIIYPKKDMIFYRGMWICRWHFEWYAKRKIWDVENRIDVASLEEGRGTE